MVYTDRFLFLDGSYFFSSMLFKEGFNNFDEARVFAQYLTQAPTVLAINIFGIEQKSILMKIYGATLYGLPLLGLYFTYYLLEDKKFFIFPLFSFFLSTFYSYSFIISEAHLMVSLFWLTLVLITRTTHSLLHLVSIYVLLIIATNIYESFLFFAILYLIAISIKIKTTKENSLRLFWIFSIGIILYGMYIAAHSTLNPRDPDNIREFLKALLFLKDSFMLEFYIAFALIAYVVCKKNSCPILLTLLFIGTLSVVVLNPHFMQIGLSYDGRMLLLIFPFGFGFIFLLFFYIKKISNFIDISSSKVLASLKVLSVVFIAFQIAISIHWSTYIRDFESALNQLHPNSLQDYQRTLVGEQSPHPELLDEFFLRWTYPFMSYALQQQPKAIIINEKSYRSLPNPYTVENMMSKTAVTYYNSPKKIRYYMLGIGKKI